MSLTIALKVFFYQPRQISVSAHAFFWKYTSTSLFQDAFSTALNLFPFPQKIITRFVVFLWDESRHLRYKNAYYLLCLVVSSTVSSFYFFFVFWPLVYLFLCFTCIFSNRKRWLVRIETLQRQISSPLFIIIWLTSTCPNGSLSQCWMPFLHVTSVELFWTPFVTLNFSLLQIVCLNEIGNYMYFENSVFIPCLFSVYFTSFTPQPVEDNMTTFRSCIFELSQKISKQWLVLCSWSKSWIAFYFAVQMLLGLYYFCSSSILRLWSCQD